MPIWGLHVLKYCMVGTMRMNCWERVGGGDLLRLKKKRKKLVLEIVT